MPIVRILGKDNQIHSWKTHLGSFDNVANLLCILNNLIGCMKSRHGVLKNTYSYSVLKRMAKGREENQFYTKREHFKGGFTLHL